MFQGRSADVLHTSTFCAWLGFELLASALHRVAENTTGACLLSQPPPPQLLRVTAHSLTFSGASKPAQWLHGCKTKATTGFSFS